MKESFFEKKLNIDTSTSETRLDKIKYYNRYEATPYEALEYLLKNYEIKRDDHLVDFGSGKGRVSFFINYYRGAACTGVELIEEFHKKAISNLKNYRTKNIYKAEKLFFINNYAEKYVVSNFENKFFFFNPFSLNIFISVVNNIISSYEECQRQVDIIMYYPSQEYIDYLERNTAFMYLKDIDINSKKDLRERFTIYRLDDSISRLGDKLMHEIYGEGYIFFKTNRCKNKKIYDK